MAKMTYNRIISIFLVFSMLFAFAAFSEEAFDMKELMDNVLKIHTCPVKIGDDSWDVSNQFKGTQAEKEEIEKNCKQQIAAMMANIAKMSDVSILKPLLEDGWVFFNCIREIVAEQEKISPELNHKIMDFIIDNGVRSVSGALKTAAVYYVQELIDCQLPEANLSLAFRDYAVDCLFTGRIHFWHYFQLPETTRKSMHPRLRELSKKFAPISGSHSYKQMKPLSATACLAFDGDEEAIAKLCLYLDHIVMSNFDCGEAIIICTLSKQRKVIDKIIHIMKTDMREIPFDGCVPPISPRRTAAIALSMIDKNFPPYTHRAWDNQHDSEIEICLAWLKTHEIDLKQPFYPKGLYHTGLGFFR